MGRIFSNITSFNKLISMTRIILYSAAAMLLAFASCKKDDSTPDNCHETQLTGIYNSVSGTIQSPGQSSGQPLADSEKFLTIVGSSCNVTKIAIGSTIGGFDADCVLNGTMITGTSADNNSTYTYDTATKKVTIKYVTTAGFTYNITGKK
jgi:hypothetical protein